MHTPSASAGTSPFLLATTVVLVAVSTVAVWSGAASVSFADVFAVLYAHVGGPPVDPLLDRIVWGLRVPRILIAALAGAGLSLAGAVLQALVRNPIADPYILGVGSGASFGAVLIMTTGIGTGLSIGVPVAAFLGAMVSLIAVLVLGRREGMLVPLRHGPGRSCHRLSALGCNKFCAVARRSEPAFGSALLVAGLGERGQLVGSRCARCGYHRVCGGCC